MVCCFIEKFAFSIQGGGPIDLKKLAGLYYGGKIPDNIKLYFLKEEEYDEKYKELSKQIYGRADKDYYGSLGYCLYDKRKDIYHVLLKDCDGDYGNAYALNLFHELSHVDTMPYKIGTTLFCSSKQKDDMALVGFEFWKEYIAQYEAVNKYQMVIGEIHFLNNSEAAKKVINRLKESYEILLYEIILYSEITGIYIDEITEETKELIECLKQIRNGFHSKEEMKNISKKDLSKIGKQVIKIYKKIEERKKYEE